MWDKKVKSSFDQNSSLRLPVLSSVDSWGQKNVLIVHLTICGLAALAKCIVFPEQTVLFVFLTQKRAISSSELWLRHKEQHMVTPIVSASAEQRLCWHTQAVFLYGSIFLLSLSKRSKPQLQVTQFRPRSCLVTGNEQRLSQAVLGRGQREIPRLKWHCDADPSRTLILGHGLSVCSVPPAYTGICLWFAPVLVWNLNMA